MKSRLIEVIVADDPVVRNRPLEAVCSEFSTAGLLAEAAALEDWRRGAGSLYERVRGLFFLAAIYRYALPGRADYPARGRVPAEAHQFLYDRRFEEAIASLRRIEAVDGPNDAVGSALAAAYHALAFQTLADQVRLTVRSTPGNAWMFRTGHLLDHPLRLRRELLRRAGEDAPYPVLRESTPVRMDLTHCGWSDIFFLGMDFPEGARVLNVSIDLGVHGRDAEPNPPITACLRVIEEPVLRLTSVDLEATADLEEVEEVFDFGRDYLGLLKAAVIAAGIVPPGLERSGLGMAGLFDRLIGPGMGLELVSSVNRIPKGSRLAVSTNLLGALVAVCMRATGQTRSLAGPLGEAERRMVAARAILGEWLGGSGGGWQDSGGLWPGIKLIEGVPARAGDAEYGISRGCLLPRHTLLGPDRIPETARRRLQESLVLVHGGMAQNVGPILEMVTEKYLLRGTAETEARRQAIGNLDGILDQLGKGDLRALGASLTANFFGPLQTIIPWVSNRYTELLIERSRAAFGGDFWGFWMLGGMSGGGMGFIFAPERRAEAQQRLQEIMTTTKRELETALPFAMDPVVYDFAINEAGSRAEFFEGGEALLPPGYYQVMAPAALRAEARSLSATRRRDLAQLAAAARTRPEFAGASAALLERLLPGGDGRGEARQTLVQLLEANGFDPAQHEAIRQDLRAGRTGLAQNRLPPNTRIEDADERELFFHRSESVSDKWMQEGRRALAAGEAAVVTFAAGVGSRWTQGAGVVKALHPFAKLAGRHRNFLEVHLAKTRRAAVASGTVIPHLITTSHLTHDPIEAWLRSRADALPGVAAAASPGRSIGLRMIPMVRDLYFAWQETAQQRLDEQKEKVRESGRAALINWARSAGEGADYTDNLPTQCLHPVGHWFELPNLLKNGHLHRLLTERPGLKYLLAHNIDTLGATLEPALLGWHIASGHTLSFEVIARRLEDRGGGLARVDGRLRLLEGLALPREEDEYRLSYYNTNTSWISIERLLELFGLERGELADSGKVSEAVRAVAARMPTYITLKEVKKRWGHGQEDVFPVAQFEKLWGDMTALPECRTGFAVVGRERGQQLKDQAQLDGWVRDGSAAGVEALGEWD
ncbi:MAG: UTP--glucose-1-phosphate uridylyltransferase [Puniceicoccaceae bacterium]|nr:MAG: UTP--glucose-1-phosphate uridylyltransferase [Puniceicoccaceae bacterium]